MFDPRLSFLAADEEFDDFSFEDEPIDLESEIGEYRLDEDDDDLLDSLPAPSHKTVPIRIEPSLPQVKLINRSTATVIHKLSSAPNGVLTKSTSLPLAKPAPAKSPKVHEKSQKSSSSKKGASKQAGPPAVNQTNKRKISSKNVMKDATKKAVKKAAKKAAVKAPAPKAPAKKAPAKKAPAKTAPAKKAPAKKAVKKAAKKK